MDWIKHTSQQQLKQYFPAADAYLFSPPPQPLWGLSTDLLENEILGRLDIRDICCTYTKSSKGSCPLFSLFELVLVFLFLLFLTFFSELSRFLFRSVLLSSDPTRFFNCFFFDQFNNPKK